jgi:putative ABC transport system substrate-binding protein
LVLRGAHEAARVHRLVRQYGGIGFLSGVQQDDWQLNAFRMGLKDGGYVEGRNLAIKYRSADGRYDRLPALAIEFVNDRVDAIIATAPPAALAAKAATTKVPIVFAIGSDPVQVGLVTNFNRPGGNITGVHFPVTTLAAKRLDLLRQLIPTGTVFGFLVNPANSAAQEQTRDARAAAASLGLELIIESARSEREIDASFTSFAQHRVQALLVGADASFVGRRDQLVALAARNALPAIYHLREMAGAGGLMSYGPDSAEGFRLAGRYAARVLKGENPGDLPVQQSVKYELIVNLKTARSLGLTVPPTLLALADEVIE